MRAFTYERAHSAAEAAASATRVQGAKFIAGGTNLLNLMKLEIEAPTHLIDVNGLALDKIEETPDGGLRIGALVRNTDLAAESQRCRRTRHLRRCRHRRQRGLQCDRGACARLPDHTGQAAAAHAGRGTDRCGASGSPVIVRIVAQPSCPVMKCLFRPTLPPVGRSDQGAYSGRVSGNVPYSP